MTNAKMVTAVKNELDKRHMTYKELSELSGVPIDTLNNFFRGKTKNPRIDTIQAIERALGLSSTFTDEDYANGVTDKARIEVTVAEYEWLELRKEVIEVKGEDYLNTLITMIKAVVKEKP